MSERQLRFRGTIPVIVVVTCGMLAAAFTLGGAAPPLRDRHSEPSPPLVAVSSVAVTASGKLFHDPRCPYLHGVATVEDLSVAVARGYSPCPRCLGALRHLRTTAAAGGE